MIDNKEIEKRLASAFDAAAPDMLDDLMAELKLSETPEPAMREKLADEGQERYKKAVVRSRGFRTLISCAAALIMVIGGLSVWSNINRSVMAVVDLDVNPSIELSINGKEKVIGAKAVNAEGEDILADMDLKGSNVNVACNAIVGSMMTKGYLNDHSNSVLVSVSAKDATKGHMIEESLSNGINAYMDDSAVSGAILGQYVEDDDELEDFAEQNGISLGKAWLIRNLLETGGQKMTEESLLSLSTQELIVLSQERNAYGGTLHGTAYTGEYIGYENALATALADAGVDASQVSDSHVEMDCENGAIIYEVEFKYGGQEYEYEVDAVTGNIVKSEAEADDDLYDDADDDDDDADDRDDDDHDDHDDDRDDHDDNDDHDDDDD
jgi:uncharacterized membrane protein YkoI